MNTNPALIERECHVFTRYLVRRPATPYVVDKYLEAHRFSATFVPLTGLDSALVTAARWSPAATRVADAYARVGRPRGALRKKLVLLLAILETSAPFYRVIDREPQQSIVMVALHLLAVGAIGALAAMAGMLAFLPLQLADRVWNRPRE